MNTTAYKGRRAGSESDDNEFLNYSDDDVSSLQSSIPNSINNIYNITTNSQIEQANISNNNISIDSVSFSDEF